MCVQVGFSTCLIHNLSLFIRSSNKMPAGVKESLRFAAVKCGSLSEEEAARYITELDRSGRLIEECWS